MLTIFNSSSFKAQLSNKPCNALCQLRILLT